MQSQPPQARDLIESRLSELRAEIAPLKELYESHVPDPLQAAKEIAAQGNEIRHRRDERVNEVRKLKDDAKRAQEAGEVDDLADIQKRSKFLLDEISSLVQKLKSLSYYTLKDHQRYLNLEYEIQSLENKLAHPAANATAYEVSEQNKRHVITTINLMRNFMLQGNPNKIEQQFGFKLTQQPKPTDEEIIFAAPGTKQTIKLTEKAVWGDVHTVDDAKQIGAAMAAIFMESAVGRIMHHVAIEKSDNRCSDEAIAELERIYARAFVDNNFRHVSINGRKPEEILALNEKMTHNADQNQVDDNQFESRPKR